MPHKKKEYLDLVKQAIQDFQYLEFFSDRELSLKAWLSPTMVSKIKNWTTLPKLSTLRKLKIIWVDVPRPSAKILNKQ